MSTVIRRIEYETVKKAVTYSVAESCCDKFIKPDPTWVFCPFCGAQIVYETQIIATGEAKEAK
jgi:hypothetical protein